jgi:hypothetical protein
MAATSCFRSSANETAELFCYLVGNPLSMFAVLGCSGFLVYQWWIGLMGGVALMVAVFAIGTTMNATQKVSDYGRAQRPSSAPVNAKIEQFRNKADYAHVRPAPKVSGNPKSDE